MIKKHVRIFALFILSSVFLLATIFPQVEALQQFAGSIEVNIQPGETKTFEWGFLSDKDVITEIELRAEGIGSEFLSFPKSQQIEPREVLLVEFSVTVPPDYEGSQKLMPDIYAVEFGETGGQTQLNIQMKKTVTLIITQPEPVCGPGTVLKDGLCVSERASMTTEMQQKPSNGGGCLIATATYGSELAPQVQMLREIRDNSLLQTQSGQSFMQGFNQFYYSFSPTIADYERQNPVFKEAIKITITPLISSLSILNFVEMDSEFDVLGYGIGLIMLNVGMYFVAPVMVIHRIKKNS